MRPSYGGLKAIPAVPAFALSLLVAACSGLPFLQAGTGISGQGGPNGGQNLTTSQPLTNTAPLGSGPVLEGVVHGAGGQAASGVEVQAYVVGNNGSGLVSTNSAALVSNNSAALVSNNSAAYRIQATATG